MPTAHFVGRRTELSKVLEAAMQQHTTLLVGEAGIGKSAILNMVSRLLKDIGTTTVLEISRVNPFGSFLRELAEELHHTGLMPAPPDKALKGLTNNDAKAKKLCELLAQSQSPAVILIDDCASVTASARPWLESMVELSTVIAAATPDALTKKGTKRFWKRFDELRIEPLSKEESTELLEHLITHYHIHTDDLEVYKRRVLMVTQGNPFELEQLLKRHAGTSLVKASDLAGSLDQRVDTDVKTVAIVPWLIVLSPLAIVWRYVARAQGDMDGMVISAFGVAAMFILGFVLRGALKPRSS